MGQGLRGSSTSIVWFLMVSVVGLGWGRSDWAQEVHLSKSRQGSRTVLILLLTRPEIQRELQLSPTLIADAKSLGIELQRKALALHGKTGAGVLTARRSIDEQQTQWLDANLTAIQLERLHQLDLQWEGPIACVSRPMIADYLRLSVEQRESMNRLIDDRARTRKQTQKSIDSEEDFTQALLNKLSKSQQEQWATLQGKPIQFLPDQQPQESRSADANDKVRR